VSGRIREVRPAAAAGAKYMTVEETAELLRCSKRSVIDKAKRGVLPSVRSPGGRRLLFPRERVLALLEPDDGSRIVRPSEGSS
jgi:excisionase family DNA binding protein